MFVGQIALRTEGIVKPKLAPQEKSGSEAKAARRDSKWISEAESGPAKGHAVQ